MSGGGGACPWSQLTWAYVLSVSASWTFPARRCCPVAHLQPPPLRWVPPHLAAQVAAQVADRVAALEAGPAVGLVEVRAEAQGEAQGEDPAVALAAVPVADRVAPRGKASSHESRSYTAARREPISVGLGKGRCQCGGAHSIVRWCPGPGTRASRAAAEQAART